ncbi:MAG TPA: peptidylprolyl isomerase, partial [Chroococcales cyanobacterium]
MNKSTLPSRQLTNLFLVSLVVASSLSLTACNKTEEKTGTTSTSTSTSTSASTSTANSSNPDTKSSADGGGKPSDGSSGKPDSIAPKITANIKDFDKVDKAYLPQIVAAQRQIRLDKMPNSVVICTVAGTPITVGAYRSQLQQKSEELQAQLSADPHLLAQLLAEGKRRGISLTADEKKRLIETTKKADKATGGVLGKLMQKDFKTQDDFIKHVLDVGEAFKVGTQAMREQLLQQMVDRELMCAAARTAGYSPRAFNYYVERRKQKDFKDIEKQAKLSGEELRDEIMKDELVRLMVEKIQSEAKVDDKVVEKYYNDNKDKFKHGERIRLSQIVIAAPKMDMPPVESVRTQLKKSNPKWSDEELAKQVKVTEQQLKMRADELLEKAKKGGDFAALANENTDDAPVRALKNGGEMGFQEKSSLL